MQIKLANQIEQSRRFSEIEDAVNMKLILCGEGRGKLEVWLRLRIHGGCIQRLTWQTTVSGT